MLESLLGAIVDMLFSLAGHAVLKLLGWENAFEFVATSAALHLGRRHGNARRARVMEHGSDRQPVAKLKSDPSGYATGYLA